MACESGKPGLAAVKRDAAVREIVRAWRSLTGGRRIRDAQRRTLVACSGGADSSALAIALGSASEDIVLGHVVHDMRARETALADRDAAARLAERLGARFASREICTGAQGGNREGVARTLRYGALREMADLEGCGYVATAHQGDDQAETMLMRLMRGCGPKGLSGIAERRGRIIRPMLGLSRADSERVCGLFGWAWSVDRTNADLSRLRASLRHEVMPILRRLSPSFARRLGGTSRLLAESAELVGARARSIVDMARDAGGSGLCISRDTLRKEPRIVIGEVLREIVRRGAGRGDGLPERVLRAAAGSIGSDATDPKEFFADGLRVEVSSSEVRCSVVVRGSSGARRGSAPRST